MQDSVKENQQHVGIPSVETQQYIKQTFVFCQTDVDDDSALLIIILPQSLAKNKPQPLNIMQLCCPQLAHTNSKS